MFCKKLSHTNKNKSRVVGRKSAIGKGLVSRDHRVPLLGTKLDLNAHCEPGDEGRDELFSPLSHSSISPLEDKQRLTKGGGGRGGDMGWGMRRRRRGALQGPSSLPPPPPGSDGGEMGAAERERERACG